MYHDTYDNAGTFFFHPLTIPILKSLGVARRLNVKLVSVCFSSRQCFTQVEVGQGDTCRGHSLGIACCPRLMLFGINFRTTTFGHGNSIFTVPSGLLAMSSLCPVLETVCFIFFLLLHSFLSLSHRHTSSFPFLSL